MAQHRETWSSRHASAPSLTLGSTASCKDDGKGALSGLEHRPGKSPTRQGNTAGRSGKCVVVERRGVEVLDVEANFFKSTSEVLRQHDFLPSRTAVSIPGVSGGVRKSPTSKMQPLLGRSWEGGRFLGKGEPRLGLHSPGPRLLLAAGSWQPHQSLAGDTFGMLSLGKGLHCSCPSSCRLQERAGLDLVPRGRPNPPCLVSSVSI